METNRKINKAFRALENPTEGDGSEHVSGMILDQSQVPNTGQFAQKVYCT
jgi:hypothetical protein